MAMARVIFEMCGWMEYHVCRPVCAEKGQRSNRNHLFGSLIDVLDANAAPF